MKDNTKKIIILIEDEEVVVNLLTKKLKAAGYEVKTAADGISGLELIRTAKPDLVLLDMILPRLGGLGVLKKLVEEKILPDLPVVVISNSGQQVDIDHILKLGVRDYLVKVNFNPNEIIAKVHNVFSSEDAQDNQTPQKVEPALATILLIEDDIFLVDILEKKLIQARFKVFRALDGDQAHNVLAKEHIDAILLDIILPGTNGLMLLKEFKADQRIKSIPVIIISNLGQKEEMQRGLEAGALHYIVKAHATPGEIVAKVKEIINK